MRLVPSRRPFLLLGAATVVLAASGLVVAGTQAAAPTEGTVSSGSPATSWGGGPFPAPNVTGNALDAPDCSAPKSCDDFTLHVKTAVGYGSDHRLTVSVKWPTAAADFDVYVLDGSGDLVGSSVSSADPERVVLPADPGDYTVRVVPFTPLADSYTATATVAAAPAAPAPGTHTPAGFTTYAAPSDLDGANNAGEPSIGNSWKSGATMYQAGTSTFKVGFDDSVSPARASWSDVSASAATGCPQGSTVSLDPILFTDHTTGRTTESQLAAVDSLSCTTDDDGASWLPSQGAGLPNGADHQTVGGGPYSKSGLGPLPTSSYPDITYYCSQDIATALCSTSRDGGTTYGPGVPVYSLLDCGGLHGHIKVGPDGTAYLPNKACGSEAAVVVSTDNGATWTVRHVTGSSPSDADPSAGIGRDGTVYTGYVGSDDRPGIAVSKDQGRTWQHNQVVGGDLGVKNAVFPTVVAGDGDRAAFAFLGTPTAGDYQSPTFEGVWHLYVASTYDGGKTWQTSDATPKDPVQRGSICTGGTTCGDNRNLLDFIDSTIDSHGRVEVGFADGCIKTCATDASQSSNTTADAQPDAHAAYATIARQSSGLPLFSAYDPKVTNVRTTGVSVTRSGKDLSATVTLKNTGTTRVRSLSTAVTDNGRTVGTVTGTSLGAGRTTTVRVTWRAPSRKHSITAVADPANTLAESDEGDNKYTVAFRG